MGARPDDPTGPTHSGYRQYSLRAVLCWSLLAFFVGAGLNVVIGYTQYESAYANADRGVWERLDPDDSTCKFSEPTQISTEYTLGMPEGATKYTYRVVCDTPWATPENGFVAGE